MEFTTNAPKGAVLMSRKKPGWFRRVDLEAFDIACPWRCVLGQSCGGYRKGLEELFGFTLPLTDPWEHGFIGDDAEEDALLNSEWTAIIRELQEADRGTER